MSGKLSGSPVRGRESLAQELSLKTIYAHGTLGMPLAVIGYPLAIWIPAHYSGGLGISLAAVGTILMLARLTDVVTDPLMGEISDRIFRDEHDAICLSWPAG